MRVRLLGPLEVTVDGAGRPVPGLRRKAVLAALALHPGGVVSTDHLIAIVWGESAPVTAATTVQSNVSRLRSILGARDAILARAPGYLLDLGAEGSDAQVAERLVRQATLCADPADRVRLLRQAIALWRGRSLADLAGLAWFAGHTHRLDDLLLHARHLLVDARLALGEHVLLIPELEALARQHPLHERTHAQLMLALYRAGRQGDALAAYQRLRRFLADELGADPGQSLRDLEAAIVRQDPQLIARHALTVEAPTHLGVVPAQLPPAPTGFTGRAAELDRLDGILAAGSGDTATRAVICGPAGIGKTWLAVHWAHRVTHRFPDGQLHVDLRGFDPADVVRGFLDAFGIPPRRIPTTVDGQVALYRSLLAGRRMLLVLDNAGDAAQVRPLLPAAAGCVVVVTSRSPLLVTEGAHLVTLDPFTAAEARDMLARRLGARRLAAEPDAADTVVARCERLPLALAVVGARAAARPDLPLATIAAELDAATVFSWSYRTLNADAARLFRLLAVHPGPDLTAAAATSIAGLPPDHVRHLLADLTRAHLLTERGPGRFAFHDLIRAYATEQTTARDTAENRRVTLLRMLDHYLHSAQLAAQAWPAVLVPTSPGVPPPGVVPEVHTGVEDAMEWFAAERPVLVAAVERAAAAGFAAHAWKLAHALAAFLDLRGYWRELIAVQHVALDAAVRADDTLGQAYAVVGLAFAYARTDQLDDADIHYRRALDLFTEAGSHAGMAAAHRGISGLWLERDDPVRALDHARQALMLVQVTGDRVTQACALNAVGWCLALLGDHAEALNHSEEALVLLQHLGDRFGEAATWDGIGDAHDLAGDVDAAHDAWHQALDLFTDLDDPRADQVRAKLRSRPAPAARC